MLRSLYCPRCERGCRLRLGEREGLEPGSGDSSATAVSLKLATEPLRGSCAEVQLSLEQRALARRTI